MDYILDGMTMDKNKIETIQELLIEIGRADEQDQGGEMKELYKYGLSKFERMADVSDAYSALMLGFPMMMIESLNSAENAIKERVLDYKEDSSSKNAQKLGLSHLNAIRSYHDERDDPISRIKIKPHIRKSFMYLTIACKMKGIEDPSSKNFDGEHYMNGGLFLPYYWKSELLREESFPLIFEYLKLDYKRFDPKIASFALLLPGKSLFERTYSRMANSMNQEIINFVQNQKMHYENDMINNIVQIKEEIKSGFGLYDDDKVVNEIEKQSIILNDIEKELFESFPDIEFDED